MSNLSNEILKEIGLLNPKLPTRIYDKRVSEIKIKHYKTFLKNK